jgi:hypothetical protein
MKKLKDNLIACVMVAVILAGIGAVLMVQPYMESRTYNKLTGANTTAWDALWVELRVQDQPRKETQE